MTTRLSLHQIDPDGAADGTYEVEVTGGKVTGLVVGGGSVTPNLIVPLTTSINGVPELVWDADNQLVFTEVPQ